MGVLKGDFIGFTFNGIHSSSLGIVRTDNGGRFTESLLPVMQDKIVPVPGGDGSYFFGSYYTQKDFAISFAFDSLTELQIKRIRQVFGDKKIHSLIFDEMPFKTYHVKVSGMATLKYICFEEGEQNRLYKGEGDIQFTALTPFATVSKKYLDKYIDKNKNEWAEASGLLPTQGDYDKVLAGENSGGRIKLFNPGDIPADWELKVNFSLEGKNSTIPAVNISIGNDVLRLSSMKVKGEDSAIKINSKNNLIEGYQKGIDGTLYKSGNVYNEYVSAGSFFKIPCTDSIKEKRKEITMNFDNPSFVQALDLEPLTYDLRYF